MAQSPFRLITLGRLALVSPNGIEDESLSTRRRKLALLAVLVLARRPLSRDVLIEMFWGDQEEARARHSLSDALSHLRRVLGREAISTRQAEIGLADTRVTVDAVELADAAAAKDYARVVSLYGGPFLSGVYAADSATLEHWVAGERSRLQVIFHEACAKQCLAHARARAWDECEALARRWLEEAPTSADAALYLLNAIKAPGTREAGLRALAEYERLRFRLARDYEQEPALPVSALADRLASEIAAGADELAAAVGLLVSAEAAASTPPRVAGPSPIPPATTPAASVEQGSTLSAAPLAPTTASTPPATPVYVVPATTEEWRALRPNVKIAAEVAGQQRPRRGGLVIARIAGAALLGVSVLVTSRRFRDGTSAAASPNAPPSVAIMSIRSTNSDSASLGLEEALTQLLASKLSRTEALEVVAPERVRQLLVRAQLDTSRRPSIERLADLGRRVGARWMVSGMVSQGDSGLALDLSVHDVETALAISVRAVQGRDILALADAAAAQLLNAAGLAATGPRLADVETASVEAYESYVRAVLAGYAGRTAETARELDAAIARDSGFVSALRARLRLAEGSADTAAVRRLTPLIERYRSRMSDYERQEQEVFDAFYGGEHERSEALGRAFVARFPRDPRAYSLLANIYQSHGRWDDAEQTLRAELALDSLALEAGSGACAPCGAYFGLFSLQWANGDLAGAEQSARRFVQLQPDSPLAWSTLSSAMLHGRNYDEALAAARRMMILSGSPEPGQHELFVRILLAKRDFTRGDSAIRALETSSSALFRQSAADLRMQLLRERGRFRASIAVADSARAEAPSLAFLVLVKGNSLGHIGAYETAAELYEKESHPAKPGGGDLLPTESWGARAFVWHHTLLADAIATGGDTVRLRAIADTLDLVSRRSYYGRDWKMAHHVRGLIAMRARRYEEAIREFERALWSPLGFTRTNAELARAYLALGRPADAIRVLRFAHATSLDAMGRYLTKTEIDYLLAIAFAQAGATDSSAWYRERARLAWQDGDPEVKARLDSLPALTGSRGQSC